MKRLSVVFLSGILFANSLLADDGKTVLATYGQQSINVEKFAQLQPGLVSWIGIGTGVQQIKSALEDAIFQDLVSSEAQKSGLLNEPDVQEEVNKILVSAYMKRHVAQDTIQIQESDVVAYYEANKDKYKEQEQYRVAHILVSSEKAAQNVESELKKGKKWEAVASQLSIDVGTAKRNGEIGLVPPNALIPEVREAAKKLDAGQISGPVKSSFGFHIVKLLEKPTIKYRPFEDTKKDIYNELFRDKKRDLVKNVKEDLWKKYNVTLKDDAIDQLVKERSASNSNVDMSSVERAKRQAGQPTELQVISETMEMGKIAPKKVTHSILMLNNSSKQIGLVRVGSTCKCMDVTAESMSIEPGKTVKLTFVYDPVMLKEQGRVEKLLFIESSDSIEPRKFIRLYYEIDRT